MNRGKEFWQEVRRAYENGEGSYEVLAERFGVTPEFMRKAVCLYTYGNLAAELYL